MNGYFRLTIAAAAAAAFGLIPSQAFAQDIGSRLLQDAKVREALVAVERDEPRAIADQIRLCEIPAPPFKEQLRAQAYADDFRALGLRNVRIDGAGNVLGDRPGRSQRPRLVLSAHLDTVFPEGTDVKVKRDATMLRGPGIGDDCRGLAALLAIVRALDKAGVHTEGSITFVGTVGEEGLGDLRGVKRLFGDTLKDQVDRFVSVDGGRYNITNTAVGSIRYRVTFTGEGGHSFNAFGIANPSHALGRAIAAISDVAVPTDPKTTFNVGRVGGGTSVNAISEEAWMDIDMRSGDILRALGNKRNLAVALNGLANIHFEQRRFGDAERLYAEVLTISREIGDKIIIAQALSNLASVFYERGDLRRSASFDAESLALRREIGDKRGIAASVLNMAEGAVARGDLSSASEMYAESAALYRELGNRGREALALSGLGAVRLMESNLAEARHTHEAALALRVELNDRDGAAETHLSLAEVALEESDPAEAQRLAALASTEFVRSGRNDLQARLTLSLRGLFWNKASESWLVMR